MRSQPCWSCRQRFSPGSPERLPGSGWEPQCAGSCCRARRAPACPRCLLQRRQPHGKAGLWLSPTRPKHVPEQFLPHVSRAWGSAQLLLGLLWLRLARSPVPEGSPGVPGGSPTAAVWRGAGDRLGGRPHSPARPQGLRQHHEGMGMSRSQGCGTGGVGQGVPGESTQLALNDPLNQAVPPHQGLFLSGRRRRRRRRRDAGHGQIVPPPPRKTSLEVPADSKGGQT